MSDFDIGYLLGVAFMGGWCVLMVPDSMAVASYFALGTVIGVGGRWLLTRNA